MNAELTSVADNLSSASTAADDAATLTQHDLFVSKLDADIVAQAPPPADSVMPQVGTPPDAASIPIDPPHGTPPPPIGELLPDVEMAEQPDEPAPTMQVDDAIPQVEVTGADETPNQDAPSSSSPPPNNPHHASSVPVESSATSPSVAHDHPGDDPSAEQQRPAKRARNAYDLAPNATLPVSSAPLSVSQHRFALSTIRALKKSKDAIPFNQAVDWVALQIPHYPNIITHPMDFGTVERKLASSNPVKPDHNLANPRFACASEFESDVRQVFFNCYTFNGVEHIVSQMARRLEEMFNKQIKQMPADEEPKYVAPKAPTPPVQAPSPPLQKKPSARRPSAANLPAIRRSEPSENNPLMRPKREIHPPPPKDLPYADLPNGKIKGKGKGKGRKREKDDGTLDQFRYCGKIIDSLYKKQHSAFAGYFYDPVDASLVPDYYKVIKKPVDFSTMKKRLDTKEYPTPQHFYQDFKLMIRNCFTFNPAGSVVHNAGAELQKLFEDKWKGLPPLRAPSPEEDEDEEESEDEHAQTIAMMENQLETMRESISALKSKKPKKDKLGKLMKSSSMSGKAPKPKTMNGGSSKSSRPSVPGAINGKKSSNKKKKSDEHRTLSFDEKKELAQKIGSLEEGKVEKVIQIIHEAMPHTQEDQNDIEIDMDVLPAAALIKLYDFVIKPKSVPVINKPRPGRPPIATGGLKRKSMDEAAEAERIRALEARVSMFEKANGGGANGHTNGVARPIPAVNDSGHSSDSESGSSGSDSGSESE